MPRVILDRFFINYIYSGIKSDFFCSNVYYHYILRYIGYQKYQYIMCHGIHCVNTLTKCGYHFESSANGWNVFKKAYTYQIRRRRVRNIKLTFRITFIFFWFIAFLWLGLLKYVSFSSLFVKKVGGRLFIYIYFYFLYFNFNCFKVQD